jgi:hypothetical protein
VHSEAENSCEQDCWVREGVHKMSVWKKRYLRNFAVVGEDSNFSESRNRFLYISMFKL